MVRSPREELFCDGTDPANPWHRPDEHRGSHCAGHSDLRQHRRRTAPRLGPPRRNGWSWSADWPIMQPTPRMLCPGSRSRPRPSPGSNDEPSGSLLRRGRPAEFDDAADWYEQRRVGLGVAFTAEVLRVLNQVARYAPNWPGLRPERRGAAAPRRLRGCTPSAGDRCLAALDAQLRCQSRGTRSTRCS